MSTDYSRSSGLRAAATVVDAAHWTKVPTALFETQADELPLPGDKTDDSEHESPTAAMEVNNEDNESVQSKTAAPAPAEHEAQLQKDKRKAEALLAELAAKALPAPPVEATTELVPAEAFDEVAATRAAKKFKVVELRKKLEAAGADTKGLKPVLVARFVEVEWATAVVEHATAMAAARSHDVELAPPAPPAAETLAPKTPGPRLSLLSATAHSPADETADETALESLTPLQNIFRVSRAVLCDFPQRVEPLSGLSPGSPAGTSTAQEVEANDQFARLFRGERLRTQHLERECAAEMARADYAEARIRRLFVGINSAQVVSKERVRIRALEKNLGKVTRMYSMEKESHKETIESHKETIDRVEEIWAMKFEDNRIPYRVRMWYAEKEREEWEKLTRLFEGKLRERKYLITTREDVLKDIEVNVERTKKAMRKDVQEKAAIIIERDERIASLEKQLAEAHANVSMFQRELAETSKDRDRALADAQKLYAFRLQQAARRARERAAQARDDTNQQGPPPPSA